MLHPLFQLPDDRIRAIRFTKISWQSETLGCKNSALLSTGLRIGTELIICTLGQQPYPSVAALLNHQHLNRRSAVPDGSLCLQIRKSEGIVQ